MNKQSAVCYRLTKLGRSLAYALGVVILSLAVVISSGTPVIAAPNDSSYDQVIQIMHLGIPEYAYKGERMKDSAYAGTVIALTQTGKSTPGATTCTARSASAPSAPLLSRVASKLPPRRSRPVTTTSHKI